MCMSRRVHPQVCLKEAMIPPPFANSVKVKSIHPFQDWVLQLLSSSLALLFCETDNMIFKIVSYSWSKRVFFKIIRKMQTTFQLVPRDVQLRAWPMEAVARAEGHTEVRPAAFAEGCAVVVTPQAAVPQQLFLMWQSGTEGGSCSEHLDSRVIGAYCWVSLLVQLRCVLGKPLLHRSCRLRSRGCVMTWHKKFSVGNTEILMCTHKIIENLRCKWTW